MIRVAISATLTDEKHVTMLWDMVKEHANALQAKISLIITILTHFGDLALKEINQ